MFTVISHNDRFRESSLSSTTPLTLRVRLEGIEEGIKEGIKEGIQQGKTEGQQELVLSLLRRLFDRLDTQLEECVKQLSTEQLVELNLAVLDFSEITELSAWLDQVES